MAYPRVHKSATFDFSQTARRARCEVPASLSSIDPFLHYCTYPGHRERLSPRLRDYRTRRFILFLVFFLLPKSAYSQAADSGASGGLSLSQCVSFALQHQPALNQSLINISVARTANAINLSGWLPQVGISGSLTHYAQLPASFVANPVPGGPPVEVHNGITNTAVPVFTATQTIFNPQLLYARNAAPLYIKEAKQITDSTKINVVVAVTKYFYNLLLTLEQINVLKEDTARLERNVKDAYHQYVGGIVDETDYDEAVISLNNSKAQLRQQMENIAPGYAALKQAMGFPPEKQFNLVFDTAQMMQEIVFDTAQQLRYDKRIEYQQVQTAKKLQHALTNYYGLAFLPTVSVFCNYYQEYENNNFSDLFSRAYPYSNLGVSLNLPLFTGFSRVENVHRSRLQEQIIDWSEVNMKSQIYTEYAAALANYKYNWYNWGLLKENVSRAKNVYRIVSLQYKYGVVAYLNVIVAESNLVAAEIGYTNALFQLLSSKIDLGKAMGEIPYNSLTQ